MGGFRRCLLFGFYASLLRFFDILQQPVDKRVHVICSLSARSMRHSCECPGKIELIHDSKIGSTVKASAALRVMLARKRFQT